MITARDKFDSGSDEFSRINGSIQNVGPIGEGIVAIEGGRNQNVTVPAHIDQGKLVVFSDTLKDQVRDLGRGINAANYGAAIIAHEVDTGHIGPINSLQDRMNAEVSGYTTQEAVQRALDVRTGVNHPIMGPDSQTRIMNSAAGSVRTSCASSDHQSCK